MTLIFGAKKDASGVGGFRNFERCFGDEIDSDIECEGIIEKEINRPNIDSSPSQIDSSRCLSCDLQAHLVTVFQKSDVRQSAVFARVIEAVTDDEFVSDLEADVVDGDIGFQSVGFQEQ